MNKLSVTGLPAICFLEEQWKAQAIPPKPTLAKGQTAKYDPLSRAWRIYTPKAPKYRVIMHTDELAYLERMYQNVLITEARNELLSMRASTSPKKGAKYMARAQSARAEADACARTINELKGAKV